MLLAFNPYSLKVVNRTGKLARLFTQARNSMKRGISAGKPVIVPTNDQLEFLERIEFCHGAYSLYLLWLLQNL